MKRFETGKWLNASKLLDRILQMPEQERALAIERLGTKAGVEHELQSLVESMQRSSCLDESLDLLFSQLPSVLITKNILQGQNFGGWLLGEEIGRGGMSVVYAATRSGDRFEQKAAFKILSIAFGNDAHIESFLQERQILSGLTHPGIARMIDAGVTGDGAPFLVLEQIDGQRIDTHCQENSMDKAGIVHLIEQLCRAVAHAHRHLVVHRDINPSNVLVDQRGRPILVDFGIAKILGDAETGKTIQAFTLEYAAPEQKAGGPITTATDVFGLGMTLSNLLDKQIPDRDLKAIIHVATHEDAESRYATAKEMGDDLRAWLEDRPVVARPDSFVYLTRKFAVRNWQWLSIAGIAVVIALAGFVSTNRQAEISRQEAEKHRAVADFMLGLFEQADLMQSGADLRVSELLEDAARRAGSELASQPEALVSLLTLIASGQLELTNYKSASAALDEAQTLLDSKDISPKIHAAYLYQRGKESYEMGRFSDAVEQLRNSLALLDTEAEPDNEYYLVAASLVSYLIDAEQYDEARVLAASLVEEVGRGRAQPEALVSVTHRYAVALEVTGDIEPAFEQYEKALQLQHQFQPGNLLGRAAILQDYGIAFYFAGRFAKSESISREVLQIFRDHFEAPHPRISSALHNLAFSIVGQDRLDDAIELLKQSYEMSVALHGPDHIDTLLEQATLGSLMGRAGDYELAEPILRENISRLEQVAPQMLVQRGSIHSYLGDVLLQTGRLDESRSEYTSAAELFRDLPEDHFRVVEVSSRLEEITEKQSHEKSD